MLSPGKNGLITREEFVALDPLDIEVFVVKPVKKIAALLSHVVMLFITITITGIFVRDQNQE